MKEMGLSNHLFSLIESNPDLSIGEISSLCSMVRNEIEQLEDILEILYQKKDEYMETYP